MKSERILVTMKNKIKSVPDLHSNISLSKLEIDKIILGTKNNGIISINSIYENFDTPINGDFLMSYVNSIITYCNAHKRFNQSQENLFVTYDFCERDLLFNVVSFHGLILIAIYSELSQQSYVRLFLINLLSHFYNFFGSIIISNFIEEEHQRTEEEVSKFGIKNIKETQNKFENMTDDISKCTQDIPNTLKYNIDVKQMKPEKQEFINNSSLKRLQIFNRIDLVDMASDFFRAINYHFIEAKENTYAGNLNLIYVVLKNSNTERELFSHTFCRKKRSFLDFSKIQSIQNVINLESQSLFSFEKGSNIRINMINQVSIMNSLYIIAGKLIFYLVGPISNDISNSYIYAAFIFKINKTYIKRIKERDCCFLFTNSKYIKVKKEEETQIESEIKEIKLQTKYIIEFFTQITEGKNEQIISELKRKDQEFVNDPNASQTNQTSISKINPVKDENKHKGSFIKIITEIEKSFNNSYIQGKARQNSNELIDSIELSKSEVNSDHFFKSVKKSLVIDSKVESII